jgi:hypothetical protein
MNREYVDRIAHSLLYEGYLLYPYRSSALKNQHRFNYGIVHPPGCPGESNMMRTECVLVADAAAGVNVEVRFLQVMEREETQETIERTLCLNAPALQPQHTSFAFPLIRGSVDLDVERCAESVFRICVTIFNRSELRGPELLQSFVSTHTILTSSDGQFISSIDPPEHLREAVSACRNLGTWPVLAGDQGASDCILSSPIILYDYPQLAPESPGDLFDETEIEQILALRVMTLTDDEKKELRGGDNRARDILDRIESLPAEHLMKLHGALRNQ